MSQPSQPVVVRGEGMVKGGKGSSSAWKRGVITTNTQTLEENNRTFENICQNNHDTKEMKEITKKYISNTKQRKNLLP